MAVLNATDAATPWDQRMAVMVAFLATLMALAEIGATAAQTTYLTEHITASQSRNTSQALSVRAMVDESRASLLESLPNANEPAVRARIEAARAEAASLRSGQMRQMADEVETLEKQRTAAFHVYHAYEEMSAVLEIAIVLASVSVVTRVRQLGWAAGVLGVGATAFGMAVVLHVV